ncbi:hypothetical protein SLEP1_g13663 [Rubroshorea leprosula]|uniref:Uncharacterized protein n=1 Tax=Rubroshorea leprosula TaxID=152421 RepID=A0AAV5IT52_9ROSI|nr:hypothetical protein SLEP1_g13663 [Rubroshorea leprosula]
MAKFSGFLNCRRLLPPAKSGSAVGKILVLECSVTRALGLSSRYYGFEEVKSRTGKNERSDELEG